MAKMIIFDYGRTLYDRETDDFFPDAIPVVKTLAEKYRLSIVSVSPADEEEARIEALREQGILDHFEEIVFTASGDAKGKEYEALLRKVDLTQLDLTWMQQPVTDPEFRGLLSSADRDLIIDDIADLRSPRRFQAKVP